MGAGRRERGPSGVGAVGRARSVEMRCWMPCWAVVDRWDSSSRSGLEGGGGGGGLGEETRRRPGSSSRSSVEVLTALLGESQMKGWEL